MHHNVRHWDLEQGRCHSAAVQREALSLVSHLKKEQLQGQVGIMHPASSRKCIMFPYGLETSKCKGSQGIQALSVTCSRPHHHVLASNMPKPEVKSVLLKSRRQACRCSNYGSVALVTYSITVRMLGRPKSWRHHSPR